MAIQQRAINLSARRTLSLLQCMRPTTCGLRLWSCNTLALYARARRFDYLPQPVRCESTPPAQTE